MQKYRGFPSRLPGTDHQFTIRRANVKGVTKLIKRERFRDRRQADQRADNAFLKELVDYFGHEVFQRGCLDAGRLSWFFEREIIPATEYFNPKSYEALLRLDIDLIRVNFPSVLE